MKKNDEKMRAEVVKTPHVKSLPLVYPMAANGLPSTKEDWIKLRFMVDSGSHDIVVKKEELPNVELKPSRASKLGAAYRVADGGDLPNEGEKSFIGRSRVGRGHIYFVGERKPTSFSNYNSRYLYFFGERKPTSFSIRQTMESTQGSSPRR